MVRTALALPCATEDIRSRDRENGGLPKVWPHVRAAIAELDTLGPDAGRSLRSLYPYEVNC